MHRKIATNTIFQIITRLATSGISFIITIAIAHGFGISGYGDFIKVTAFVGLFYIAVDFGFNAIYLQKAEHPANFQQLLFLRLLVAVLLIFLLNLLSMLLPYQPDAGIGFSPVVKQGIFLYSFSLITQGILFSSTAIFQRKHQYSKLFISSLIGSLVTLLCVLFFLLTEKSILFLLGALLIGGFVSAVVSMYLTGEKVLFKTKHIDFARLLFTESIPLGVMLLLNLIYFRIDIFVLSFFQHSSAVGAYGLAYRFFDFLIALPLFLSNALYPTLLDAENNTRMFASIIKKYLVLSLGLSILILIPLWFMAPFFTLIQKDFFQSILPFRILLLSLPVFFLTNIFQWALIAKKDQRYLVFVYLIVAVLNIVLNILFIPVASFVASAIVTGISELIVLVLLFTRLQFREKNIQSGGLTL